MKKQRKNHVQILVHKKICKTNNYPISIDKLLKSKTLFTIMNEKKRLKMAVIAGAAAASKFMKNNRMATSEDAIRHVTKEIASILENIEKDGEI